MKEILKSNTQIGVVIARTVVVTPILAFALYSFRNYGKERNIVEQYAFKEISGATIEGHIEMINRAFPDSTTVSRDFELVVVGVLKELHCEPSELKKASRNIFRIKNPLLDLEAEINDIGQNVENIKEIVEQPKSLSS